jgi:hypothetical protein
MSIPPVWPQCLDFFGTPLVIEPSPGQLSSDAGTWPAPRWVVVKAAANAEGSNRRFVVTNRPGAVLLPGPSGDGFE